MITVKDFSIGEKVYVLEMNNSRNAEPTITVSGVDWVGRNYVTICADRYFQEKYTDCGSEYLCGQRQSTMLFKTRKEAEQYAKARDWRMNGKE